MMGSELEDLLKHVSPDVLELNKDQLVVGRITDMGQGGEVVAKKTGNKWKNKPTTVNGIKFQSKKEARRYQELKQMEEDDRISGLVLQPRFLLQEGFVTPQGKKIRPIHYHADFMYKMYQKGILYAIIEDVKGNKNVTTAEFKLKWKMVQYVYREKPFYEFVLHD